MVVMRSNEMEVMGSNGNNVPQLPLITVMTQ
jgi:hypothetical protein